jgi:hypothetical protein
MDFISSRVAYKSVASVFPRSAPNMAFISSWKALLSASILPVHCFLIHSDHLLQVFSVGLSIGVDFDIHPSSSAIVCFWPANRRSVISCITIFAERRGNYAIQSSIQ